MDLFREHVEFMKDLSKQYQANGDVEAVQSLKQHFEHLSRLGQTQRTRIQELLEAMEAKVEEERRKVEQCNLDNLGEERNMLHKTVETEKLTLSTLQEKIREVHGSLQGLRQQRQELNAQLAEAEVYSKQSDQKQRHMLSLYAHVLQVVWDLNAEDRIVGTHSSSKGGDIRQFELDPADADVVDKLWELCAPCSAQLFPSSMSALG